MPEECEEEDLLFCKNMEWCSFSEGTKETREWRQLQSLFQFCSKYLLLICCLFKNHNLIHFPHLCCVLESKNIDFWRSSENNVQADCWAKASDLDANSLEHLLLWQDLLLLYSFGFERGWLITTVTSSTAWSTRLITWCGNESDTPPKKKKKKGSWPKILSRELSEKIGKNLTKDDDNLTRHKMKVPN